MKAAHKRTVLGIWYITEIYTYPPETERKTNSPPAQPSLFPSVQRPVTFLFFLNKMRLRPASSTFLNKAKNRGNARHWWRHLFLVKGGVVPMVLKPPTTTELEQRTVRTRKDLTLCHLGQPATSAHLLQGHCITETIIWTLFSILDTLAFGGLPDPGRHCPSQGQPILRDSKGLSQDNALARQAANSESIVNPWHPLCLTLRHQAPLPFP